LRLWRRRRVVDVQISARDLALAALYVASEVDYRRIIGGDSTALSTGL